MNLFFWIVDLILPIVLIAIGLLFRIKPPKEINEIYGYRSRRSKSSQENWDYARACTVQYSLWLGIILFFVILILKLVEPLVPEYLSLVNMTISFAFFGILIFFVERKLKQKDENNF